MSDSTVQVLMLDTETLIPVPVLDPFLPRARDKQDTPVTVLLNPVGTMSKEKAKLLIDTYPHLYKLYDSNRDKFEVFDPNIHTDSKGKYKTVPNYLVSEINLEVKDLAPKEKEEVAGFIAQIKKRVKDVMAGNGTADVKKADKVNA